MKKLMFYINTIESGGAERVLVNLCNQFSSIGYVIYLVTSYPVKKEYKYSERIFRINLEESNKKYSFLKRNFTRVRKLRKVCKIICPDLLISFMAEPNYRALIATLGLKTKNIISIRNDPNYEYAGKVRSFIAKFLFRFSDGCVFQTEEAKTWFPKSIQHNSMIIMNQVNEKFFDMEWIPKKKVIVTVGRLVEQKNHRFLINAFAKISQEFPDVILEIWGDGKEYFILNKLISELKLEKQIFLKGVSNDIPYILSSATMFVLSSNYEGMPNVLLEAMAVGCPVISTNCPCGGPREIIEDEKNGYLVPINDIQLLSKRIKLLLENASLAKEIGGNAKKTAEQFRPNLVFQKWNSYVCEILKK